MQLEPSDWIAISGGIIALLALGLTLWEAHLIRHHNRLSVRPVLTFSLNIDHTSEIHDFVGVRLNNKGLGPAFIRRILFYSDDKQIGEIGLHTSVPLLTQVGLVGPQFRIYQFHSFDVLQPDKSLLLLFLRRDHATPDNIKRLDEVIATMTAAVLYESAYGEAFALGLVGPNASLTPKVRAMFRASTKEMKSMFA